MYGEEKRRSLAEKDPPLDVPGDFRQALRNQEPLIQSTCTAGRAEVFSREGKKVRHTLCMVNFFDKTRGKICRPGVRVF